MHRTSRWARGDTLRLFSVLLIAFGYRWYFLSGFMPPDSMAYAQYAYNLLDGSFTLDTPSWYVHRFTVFVPVAPLYWLLGVGKHTTYAWSFFLSMAQVAFVFWLGRRFFDGATAFLGALLLSLVPLDVIIAGRIVPDAVIAAFSTLALGCWIAGLEMRERPNRLLLLLSGAFFCLAVFTRPYAFVFALSYLLYLLWRRPPWRLLIWFVLGAAIVTLPILVAYAVQTGDPLYRFAVARQLGEHFGKPNWQFTKYVRTLWHPESPMGLLSHLFVLGYVVALRRASHSRKLLLVWALPFALFLQFGSMRLTSYVPITKNLRYLSPLFAPSALLAASALLQLARSLGRRLLPSADEAGARRIERAGLVGVMLVVALSSWFVLDFEQAPGREWHEASVEVADLLREHGDLPILADHWRTGIRLAYYLRYEEGADFYRGIDDTKRTREPGGFGDSRLGYSAWYPQVDLLPDALVVLDDALLTGYEENPSPDGLSQGVALPDYCFDPPDGWQLLLQAGDLRVFRTRPHS